MLLFHTEEFNFYLGEVSLLSLYALTENNNKDINIKHKQNKRENKLANNLLYLLKTHSELFENSEKQEYVKEYYQNIKNELILTPVGKLVINFIGVLYIESAKNYLTYTEQISSNLKEIHRTLSNNYNIALSIFKLYSEKEDRNKIPYIIDVLLYVMFNDIENTIKNACLKILYDSSVLKEEKINRANSLLFVGTIFNDKIDINSAKCYLKETLSVE